MRLFTTLGALFSGLFLLTASPLLADDFPKNLVVNVAVADICQSPTPVNEETACTMLTTQALYGEPLLAKDFVNGWYRVEAMQQVTYDENDGWNSCGGWIRAEQILLADNIEDANLVVTSDHAHVYTAMDEASAEGSFAVNLSMGTEIFGESETLGVWKVHLVNGTKGYIRGSHVTTLAAKADQGSMDLRKDIIRAAKRLRRDYYLCNGRSAYDSSSYGQMTGMDAAGFVNIVYRANGFHLAHSVNDMYMNCTKMSSNPQKGDLVFLSSANEPDLISHVMIVKDDNTLYEAYGCCGKGSVHKISSVEKLGATLSSYNSGDNNGEYVIRFGSFIK
ncbi:MAG: C40 family peptidase [Parachlamydiales bacterium]|nr:C40 family peptidase [Parachlamydiales bacterium]